VANNILTSSGSHIAVDECERVWFVSTRLGLQIYNSSGVEVGRWTLGLNNSNQLYDVLILPNYVIILALAHQQRIVRYDPQLSCA
jgi:hypothetical protein